MILSDMICKSRGIMPEAGSIAGVCACCGRSTELGLVFEDTGTFTTYQYFPGGDCLCPACSNIRHDRTYARTMFVCTESMFREFKFEEAEEALKTPPAEPFVMYFTRTWKKPGYLNLVNRVNFSRDRYIVGLDYELVEVDAARRDEYLGLITSMLSRGVTKTELGQGVLRPKSYDKIDDYASIARLKELAHDPLWDLCVYLCKNPNAKPKDRQETLSDGDKQNA